jgi:hypothetical protein
MNPSREKVLSILSPALKQMQRQWTRSQNPNAFAAYWVLSALYIGLLRVQDTQLADMGEKAYRFIKELQAAQN